MPKILKSTHTTYSCFTYLILLKIVFKLSHFSLVKPYAQQEPMKIDFHCVRAIYHFKLAFDASMNNYQSVDMNGNFNLVFNLNMLQQYTIDSSTKEKGARLHQETYVSGSRKLFS